jgi:hypothetical protein
VHADPLEIAALPLQVLPQRLDAGIELLQPLIDVSPLLQKMALERSQTLLEQPPRLVDDPDLVVELLVQTLQGGRGGPDGNLAPATERRESFLRRAVHVGYGILPGLWTAGPPRQERGLCHFRLSVFGVTSQRRRRARLAFHAV